MNELNYWSPNDAAFMKKRIILQKHFTDKEEVCMICLDQLYKQMAIYVPCKHVFHYNCLKQLMAGQVYTCPLCRTNFTTALSLAGIPMEEAEEEDGEEIITLTIFPPMDLYDFIMEMLWRSYDRDLEELLASASASAAGAGAGIEASIEADTDTDDGSI
jgi:hypothetical protein